LRTLADPTNAQDRFLRNRVRHRLLPLLEKEFNPGIKEGLARLASLAAADYDYLKLQADVFLNGRFLKKKGRWEVELKPLREASASLRRMAVRRLLEAAQGDLRRLTFAHAMEIEDLILSKPTGSSVCLPQGWMAKTTPRSLVVLKR
jgi:tRNA(Ile)-lysidine synthase